MPPAKRARLPSRPNSSIAAAADDPPRSSRGWLSVRRDPSQRLPRAEDDGTPLSDEILLIIFASLFPEIADLVRSAATCRRWRRLVSSEAAFICRASRRPGLGGRFMPPLALGFFHHQDAGAVPRFVPIASASRRFSGLREPSPSLSTLVDDGLFDSSRVVASRNGLIVVDLRRGNNCKTALKLCVCNPMTGAVHILPPLTGKDGLGHYACTVLTADDYRDHDVNGTTDPPPRSQQASSYRLVLVYNRRGFTAFRSYSPEHGGWSPEAKVTGAKIDKRKLGLARNGVVAPGGRAAYWLAKDVVFGLDLDTMEASVLGANRLFDMDNTSLGFTPEGRLCAVQLDDSAMNTATQRRLARILIITYRNNHRRKLKYAGSEWWGTEDEIWLEQFSLDNMTALKLRWFCERSGVVFFTAGHWFGGWARAGEAYAFSIHTRTVEKVASNDGSGDPWGNINGYEMDQAAYLTSLGEPGEEIIEDI